MLERISHVRWIPACCRLWMNGSKCTYCSMSACDVQRSWYFQVYENRWQFECKCLEHSTSIVIPIVQSISFLHVMNTTMSGRIQVEKALHGCRYNCVSLHEDAFSPFAFVPRSNGRMDSMSIPKKSLSEGCFCQLVLRKLFCPRVSVWVYTQNWTMIGVGYVWWRLYGQTLEIRLSAR